MLGTLELYGGLRSGSRSPPLNLVCMFRTRDLLRKFARVSGVRYGGEIILTVQKFSEFSENQPSYLTPLFNQKKRCFVLNTK